MSNVFDEIEMNKKLEYYSDISCLLCQLTKDVMLLREEIEMFRKETVAMNASFQEAFNDHMIGIVQAILLSAGENDKGFWENYKKKYSRAQ